jgi:hypothetical protein
VLLRVGRTLLSRPPTRLTRRPPGEIGKSSNLNRRLVGSAELGTLAAYRALREPLRSEMLQPVSPGPSLGREWSGRWAFPEAAL